MLTNDRIGGVLLLAFSVAYGLLIFDIPLLPFQAQAAFTARTMPEALSVLGILLSLTMIIKPSSDARPEVGGFLWKRGAIVCVAMVLYGLTVRPGGFLISTSLFLIACILILGERRLWLILVASVPVVLFFWVLMTQLLGVFIEPWPEFLRG
ncbi:tripartite tricarboxylate transporter TctB family protein [Pelagibius sp. Alg239-R121]|uniref:tripartite tricarboxylate transporter TctB family protein n=1 Tax=Pelagibius sp. Alg239-R121 TaxID=2993448 RepID=UPI0024A73881|nr:tripartite tricarboxylate transporter TctB family protein [Pelagibius sp. Alg239-R121]